jgi:hypothetical protein
MLAVGRGLVGDDGVAHRLVDASGDGAGGPDADEAPAERDPYRGRNDAGTSLRDDRLR